MYGQHTTQPFLYGENLNAQKPNKDSPHSKKEPTPGNKGGHISTQPLTLICIHLFLNGNGDVIVSGAKRRMTFQTCVMHKLLTFPGDRTPGQQGDYTLNLGRVKFTLPPGKL